MRIQEWIYQLEVGGAGKYLRGGAAVLVAVALMVLYDFREYKNFSDPEAMDVAQLARNISEGKGYTTDFIRPLSIHLLVEQKVHPQKILKEPHPDLANPPVYPYLLAGLMRVLPFDFDLSEEGKFDSFKYQPEQIIGIFNQLLFLVSVFLVYRLGSRLFDQDVGLFSAVIFLGTEIFWKFSVSGLSTMLLILIFLVLVNCLVSLEQAASFQSDEDEEGSKPTLAKFAILAVSVGLLLGVGALTRYSFACLAIPVLIFLVVYTGAKRWLVAPLVLVVFLAVFSPWLARNHNISGHLFGTAGYEMYVGTEAFQGDQLERSLEPKFAENTVKEVTRKFSINISNIISSELPQLGGSWMLAFFLVSLFVAFRSSSLKRLRIFILISLVALVVVQALVGRNSESGESVISSVNLVALLVPIATLYGVSLFLILLEQLGFDHEGVNGIVKTGFVVLISASLLLALLPPKEFPLSYPPYHPPRIQEAGGYFEADELIATDMPWAVAWYGNRQSLWITRNPNEMFTEVDGLMKPIRGLYLTELTLDRKFMSNLVAGEPEWGKFIVDSMILEQIPENFPLKTALSDYLPYQILLADRRRW